MDLKPVELQIAVPRTSEASRVQQDQQHRPLLDQQMIAGQNIKHADQQRTRSTGIDDSSKTQIHDQDHRESGSGQDQHSSPNQEEQAPPSKPAEHPYKGKHIDLSY